MSDETLLLHKDSYLFIYGIDIDKPIEMANKIISLKEENQQLKSQLEASEKARKEALSIIKSKQEIIALSTLGYDIIKLINILEMEV